MKLLIIAVLASLISAQADAASLVFEKADALYRPLKFIFGTSLSFGHASLYVASDSRYRFTAADAASGVLPDIVNSDGLHSVIEAPGYGDVGVKIVTFSDFLGPRSFWGAYEPAGGLDPSLRYRAILAAGRQLTKPYTMFSHWKGPDKMRCDGLVSVSYSAIGVSLPENGGVSWISNLPRTQRKNLVLRTAARAPGCQPTTRTPAGSGFALATNNVTDDPFDGSGIDRVEYWNGLPTSGGSLLGTDDHDSNPDAGLPASNGYSISSTVDPGANLFTRIFDQSGNFTTCDVLGQVVGTSDLAQISPNIVEDVTPPTIQTINVQQDPGGQTATATWTGSDDQTPAAQINYAYAVDVPFDQWDDASVTIVGQVNTTSVDISTLTEGQHTLYMIALDQEGNIGTGQATITIPAPPSVSLFDSLDTLYDSVSGSPQIPATSPLFTSMPCIEPTSSLGCNSLLFEIHSSTFGAGAVQTITVSGPQNSAVFVNNSNDQLIPYAGSGSPPLDHEGQISGAFVTGSLGTYTLTVTNTAGFQTVLPIQVVSNDANLDGASQSTYNSQDGSFKTTLVIDLSSTLGLDHIDHLDNSTLNQLEGKSLGGQPSATTQFQVVIASGSGGFLSDTVDSDGNDIFFALNTSLGYAGQFSTSAVGTYCYFTVRSSPCNPLTESYTSPTYDLMQSSMIAGAVIQVSSSSPLLAPAIQLNGPISGPIIDGKFTLAQVSLQVVGGGSLYSGNIVFDPSVVSLTLLYIWRSWS